MCNDVLVPRCCFAPPVLPHPPATDSKLRPPPPSRSAAGCTCATTRWCRSAWSPSPTFCTSWWRLEGRRLPRPRRGLLGPPRACAGAGVRPGSLASLCPTGTSQSAWPGLLTAEQWPAFAGALAGVGEPAPPPLVSRLLRPVLRQISVGATSLSHLAARRHCPLPAQASSCVPVCCLRRSCALRLQSCGRAASFALLGCFGFAHAAMLFSSPHSSHTSPFCPPLHPHHPQTCAVSSPAGIRTLSCVKALRQQR